MRLPSLPLISIRFSNHHIQPWNYFSAFATASLATAALYAREDVVTTIVTTFPETVGYTVIPSTTIETTITGTVTTVSVSGTEASGSVGSYATHTSFNQAEFSIKCTNEDSSKCDSLTEATTNFPVTEVTYLDYSGTTSYLELTESISTILEVAAFETEIITDGITTRVTLDGITTTIIVSTASTVGLTVSATTVTIAPTEYTLTVPESLRSSDSEYSETTTLSSTIIYLNAPGATTSISLEGVTTELTQITTLTLTIPESTSFFVSAGMVSSYVTTISGAESSESSSSEESISDTNVSSSEEITCEWESSKKIKKEGIWKAK